MPGLDQATHGGLPAGSAVVVLGQSGAGKTILSLQVLANAIARGEGGVMVSFEESANQLRRDANSFSWGPALTSSERLEIIDARPASGMDNGGRVRCHRPARQRRRRRRARGRAVDRARRHRPAARAATGPAHRPSTTRSATCDGVERGAAGDDAAHRQV
ncbi:MAG: ATPase domain-containing protein [Halofilum sp. (in: g-proteobacteria)]|nr:ATPase domain-containing protein [Halofilum sp. (in: g-proteobacteria)]